MPFTILLDMDDTLLTNSMEVFLPVYLKSLAASVKEVPAKNLISVLLSASEQMVLKSETKQTLEQTFDHHFYSGIGVSKEQISQNIDHFYSNSYPLLKSQTQPRPPAQKVVAHLLENRHTIAIATNPLFPKTAVLQRLDWARINTGRRSIRLYYQF